MQIKLVPWFKQFRICLLILGIQLFSMRLSAQLPTFSKAEQAGLDRWYDKYKNEEYTSLDYINLIDILDFKFVKNPELKNLDYKTIKAVFLQLSSAALKQMNLDGNYFCSLKHDEYFELWNMYYPKITKEFWDMHCKGLFSLMKLDDIIVID